MPLTSGLTPVVAISVVGAAGAVAAASLAARRPCPAVRCALRLLAAAAMVGLGGVTATGLLELSGVPAGRPGRVELAAVLGASLTVSVLLAIGGLLALPGTAENARTRMRHLLDGMVLGGSLLFVLWALIIEPLHAHYGVPVLTTSMTLRCLVVAGPSLTTSIALGVTAVIGLRAARGRGGSVLAAAGVATIALGGLTLVVSIARDHTTMQVPAAFAYAAGYVMIGGAARQSDTAILRVPDPGHHARGISVVPVAVVLVAAMARLSLFGQLDEVAVGALIGIVALMLWQQVMAREDVRRYGEQLGRSEGYFRRMAYTDPLTGLGNRRQLLKTMQDDAVGGPPCVLLAIDLDGFKNINDIRGHDVGDAVLVEVGRRLRSNLRPGDLAARLGGDEFAVLMWARAGEAVAISERLLRALSRTYELPSGTVFMSASVGMASCATATDIDTLLRNADLALRLAKQHGKNRVEQYDAAYDQLVRRRTELEQELRGAIERDELMVAYQPVVRLPEGTVAGVEALLRWHHPRLGQVSPDEFIPLAEDTGLIHSLGSFVLHEACRQLARWLADGHDLYLAVNVSVRELHTPEYAAQVAEVLRAHRVPPQQLVVEVTEHAVAQDLAQLVARLTALRATGVRVALDDFGSGYSSMGQLRRLPLDILKIDRSLLAPTDSADERFNVPLVDVVVGLGNRIGLDVVAEGITDESQRRTVEEAGCRYAQGDLFGRPVPAERAEALFPAVVPASGEARVPAQHVRRVDSGREMRQS